MRLLLINKFIEARGGAERCFVDQRRWFEAAGHEVATFGQAGVSAPGPNQFVVPSVEYAQRRRPTLRDVGRFFWSPEVARALEQAVAKARPEAAVLHNIYHHLGAAVPITLERLKVPMVMVLHDHKLVCPAYSAWRAGSRCVDCNGRQFRHALQHACGGSRARSVVLAAESLWQHRLIGSYRAVRKFVAPSAYLKTTIDAAGLGLDVAVARNGVEPVPLRAKGLDNVVGFAGRLAPEKGVELVLAAAARLRHVVFRIAGTGPRRQTLVQQAARERLENVAFLGHLSSSALASEMRSWTLALVPSLSPENCPYAVLDAMNHGIVVVGSDAAGIRELLLGRGSLYPPGDVDQLVERLTELLKDEARREALATAALGFVRAECSPEAHIRAILGRLAI